MEHELRRREAVLEGEFGVGSEGEGLFIERNDVDAVVELLDEASEGEARGRRGGGEGHGVDGSCAAKFSMEEPVSAGSPSLKQPGGGGGLLMESLLGMPMAVRQRWSNGQISRALSVNGEFVR